MMCTSASSVLLLLVVWPVATICLPLATEVVEPFFRVERTMKALEGRTVCPFSIHNTTTRGIPEKVTEYRCLNTSEEADNSLGRCTSGCVQGTVTIIIQTARGKVPKPFHSGCFCDSQIGSSPRSVPEPSVDNNVNKT